MNRITKPRCRHFTGIQHKTCEAGVTYASVREEPKGGPYLFPCLLNGGSCDKLSPLTDEEMEQKDQEIRDSLARTMKAREAIVARNDRVGAIPCPCCEGGTLRYSVAASNGHIHAACSTQGCVWWME